MTAAKRGFTLIELLVVVLIIGVLASVSIPQYFKVVERARVSEAQSVFSSVKSSQARVLARKGAYTDNWDVLDVSLKDASGNPCSGSAGCAQKAFTYLLDADGTIYAARNETPAPPAAYGRYTLIYDLNSGTLTCTQAACILDLI